MISISQARIKANRILRAALDPFLLLAAGWRPTLGLRWIDPDTEREHRYWQAIKVLQGDLMLGLVHEMKTRAGWEGKR